MSDVIMSHIFNSYYTHRALASIGSGHHVYLVDNSFCGEMATSGHARRWASSLMRAVIIPR